MVVSSWLALVGQGSRERWFERCKLCHETSGAKEINMRPKRIAGSRPPVLSWFRFGRGRAGLPSVAALPLVTEAVQLAHEPPTCSLPAHQTASTRVREVLPDL